MWIDPIAVLNWFVQVSPVFIGIAMISFLNDNRIHIVPAS
jgi:hypothetical protein